MSGRLIKNNSGVIKMSCSPQLKIILWKPFSLPSASSPIRERTKLVKIATKKHLKMAK